jgi:hypothetical protein
VMLVDTFVSVFSFLAVFDFSDLRESVLPSDSVTCNYCSTFALLPFFYIWMDDMVKPESKKTLARQKFDRDIQQLMRADNQAGCNLVRHIRQLRLKYKYLSTQLSDHDVLNEAILRAARITDRGEEIEYPAAILKEIARLILLECSRKYPQHKEFKEEMIDSRSQPPVSNALDILAQSEELELAFAILPLLDQEILILRFRQELSWFAVQEEIHIRHGCYIQQATLRQQGRRALARLRGYLGER